MKDNYLGSLTTENEMESFELGCLIGKHARPGDIICLTGDLGSGKTVMARGIVKGLGVEAEVTSPTFALLHVYQGTVPVYHFDVYRLDNQDDIQDTGFDDYVGREGVSVIEWAERIPDYLPDTYVRFDIGRDFTAGGCHRKIAVYDKGHGTGHITDHIGLEE